MGTADVRAVWWSDVVCPLTLRFRQQNDLQQPKQLEPGKQRTHLEHEYSHYFAEHRRKTDLARGSAFLVIAMAFWLKSTSVANLPIIRILYSWESWYERSHIAVFMATIVIHALPGLFALVLPPRWYAVAARPLLVGTARLTQAWLPLFFYAIAHACGMVMPCLVLRIQFVDLLATKALIVPLLLPLRFCWGLVPQVIHTITGTIALASSKYGMCAAVVHTNATTMTEANTCGHSVPPTTTACAIISIAVMVAIQLCGCLLQYLLELRERILFFERKVPQAQVHPPWNMLCTWVAWHFMLALGGVFTMLGLLL